MPSPAEAAALAMAPRVPLLAMLLASSDEYPSGQPVPTQTLDPDAARPPRMVREAVHGEPEDSSEPE